MRFYLSAVPLLAAVGTLATPIQFTPPEVQEYVEQALEQNSGYVDYDAPSQAWLDSHQNETSSSSPETFKQLSAASCSYWLEDISHQGIAAFNSDSSYKVFRNVKDFGAKGDGSTDDTAAIQSAISSGNRCAPGSCQSTSITPAVVYFPAGTYIISSSIIDYYYTQLVGNPNCLPTLKASASFSGDGIIDGDPYTSSNLGFGATNVFWRTVKNFIIDTTAIPASSSVNAMHWPTAQATSIENVIFNLNAASGTRHVGLFIESGSAGYLGDLTFNGGLYGGNWGNQQYTMRNLTFNNVNVAILQIWDWTFTYQNIHINNCQVGIDMTSGGVSNQDVGSVTIIDSTFSNTPIGVNTSHTSSSSPAAAGSLILENVAFDNVPVAVRGPGGAMQLSGNTVVAGWVEGHTYSPNGPNNFQGAITPVSRPSSLVTSNGAYYQRSKPNYASVPASGFLSARSAGATGDGKTDDTTALQNAINNAQAQGKILFVDQGDYLVSSTIYVPAGSKIVGESYSVILSHGSFFNNINNPQPVVRIGNAGESGSSEWSEMIVSTQGQQQGAVLIEYNLVAPAGTPSGIWDVHTRVGGFVGSDLQASNCPTNGGVNADCMAAYMSMHVTKGSKGLYMENNWLWTADHDVDDSDLTQISIYSGRGLLVESAGPTWLVGTAVEHHTLYQYQFSNAQNVYAGLIQTETPYYQPSPSAPQPWPYNSTINDPQFAQTSISDSGLDIPDANAWGLRVVNSQNIHIYGAGLYSFFNNYSTNCSDQGNQEGCQESIISIDSASTSVSIYGLGFVGVHRALTVGGSTTGYYGDNLDGFSDTIAYWV